MAGYTHRERVITALSHEEPDRVPLDLMGNAGGLVDASYFRLRDYLGLAPIPPVRSGSTVNYYDERILDQLDIDFRRLFLKSIPGTIEEDDDDTFSDIWGVRYQKAGLFVNVVSSPLKGVTTVQEVDAYRWPRAEDMFSAEGLAGEARRRYNETDYALVARNPVTYGFLDRASQLMEMSEFMMALALYPEVAQAIIDHILEIYKEVYGMFLDAVGSYVQMVEVGDDLGTQESLLISPRMYRKFIKPAEQELYAMIHKKAPDAALFHHTDGAVFRLLPDLIEAGVDILNPVQTSAQGMGAPGLKAAFGDSLTFHGAIEHFESDIPIDDVVAEVKERIDALAPGGGYVLAPCNHMIDVRTEVVLAIYETARDYGRYA
jgi:uroporphyrinogen decarboxylase